MSPSATPVPLNLKSWKSASPPLRPSNGIRWAIRQIHCDIDVHPILGDCHSAKWGGTTPAGAMVRCQIESDGMTVGRECRSCSNHRKRSYSEAMGGFSYGLSPLKRIGQ